MHKPVNIQPLDSAALLGPGGGGVARMARNLAGTLYRAAMWPTEDRAAATHAAAKFVLRVGIPSAFAYSASVSVSDDPHCGRGTASIPARLVYAALALTEGKHRAERVAALDRAFDLLAGYALLGCANSVEARGEQSAHGFGWTLRPLGGPELRPVSLSRMRAAFRLDARAFSARDGRTDGVMSRAQTMLAAAAREHLALQMIAEAGEAGRAPLDRARRVAAAARINPREAARADYGSDETGSALALYAREAAASDTGEEAFERFARDEDRAQPEADGSAEESRLRTEAIQDATGARDWGANGNGSHASETSAEAKARTEAARELREMPRGRAKVERDAADARESIALAAAAAGDIDNAAEEVARGITTDQCGNRPAVAFTIGD